jgi:hypothetical protein
MVLVLKTFVLLESVLVGKFLSVGNCQVLVKMRLKTLTAVLSSNVA